MSSSAPCYLISTLAEYQTEFWLRVGQELRGRGVMCAYLSFDDRSSEMLRADGFRVFSLPPSDKAQRLSKEEAEAVVRRFGISRLPFWFTHERVVFGIRDETILWNKLAAALLLAEEACAALLSEGREVLMLQEVGGFLSVIGSYYAARKAGLDNWFVEPAFFKGRMFFLRNSFAAPTIPEIPVESVSPEVKAYLEIAQRTGMLVIPQKDSHHYTTAFRKIVNVRNVKRLLVKLYDKYVCGKHQEFGYIGRHVMTHVRMLTNSFLLRGAYTPLSKAGRFVYYPLHVPADMALTLRSPAYLDQLAFIDYLARSVPHTHKVVIKEHPAMIGAIDARRLKAMLARYDNLCLLPPATNNYDVLRAADAIVSVNSKSGAEALPLGKPVIVVGDAFYAKAPFVRYAAAMTDVPGLLEEVLASPAPPGKEAVELYFERVWRSCYEGELYVNAPVNIEAFARALLAATGKKN